MINNSKMIKPVAVTMLSGFIMLTASGILENNSNLCEKYFAMYYFLTVVGGLIFFLSLVFFGNILFDNIKSLFKK